jgi:hypothetical protein
MGMTLRIVALTIPSLPQLMKTIPISRDFSAAWLKTTNKVIGMLVLLVSIVTVIPITIRLFVHHGGAFGLGWLLIPLIIPLCAGTGYGILGVLNERLNDSQLNRRFVMVHLLVALAIIVSYISLPVFPYLLYSLPVFIWVFIRYRKHVLLLLLLVNLLTLLGGLYLLATDWDNGRKVALIEVFKPHHIKVEEP